MHAFLRRPVLLCAMFLALAPGPLRADKAGDLYLEGFVAWQAGEKFRQQGKNLQAFDSYLKAERKITEVQDIFPDWQPQVVEYRLKVIRQAIENLGRSP